MKEIRLCIVLLVVVMISSVSTTANLVDRILLHINNIKGNILDRSFCTELHSGGDKYACRIRNSEKYGFLFCKKHTGHAKCQDIIGKEMEGFYELTKKSIKTVSYYPHVVTGVLCPDSGSKDCFGILEEWVDNAKGEAFHLRVYIDKNKVKEKTKEIIQRTKKEGLSTTRGDLEKIYGYIHNDGVNFRCICDLQGFYLLDGGFLVGDTEGIKENLPVDGACDEGDPTTREFLEALAYMINQIKLVEPK